MAKKKKEKIVEVKPVKKGDSLMESILGKVTSLEAQLIKAIENEDKRAEENALIAKQNKELALSLKDLEKDLKEREKAIKPIEDVVKYGVKVGDMLKEAKKKMKEAGIAQDAADKLKADTLEIARKNKQRIAEEDARILDEKKGLEKGYAQLKKAENESEVKVLKKIVKTAVK